MNLARISIPVPLRDDGHGGLRVGPTRVRFESVWRLHQQGASPVENLQAFNTIAAFDLYAVLAWALNCPEEVEAYLKRRDDEAVEIKRQLEEAGTTLTPKESAALKANLQARLREQQRQSEDVAAVSNR